LAEHFLTQGYRLKISTTSPHRLPTLAALPAEACIVDIGKPLDDIDAFLQSDTLIVNITSKDIDGFERLVRKIEASAIQSVLFVSSTSVYPVTCKVVSEATGEESPDHPLVIKRAISDDHCPLCRADRWQSPPGPVLSWRQAGQKPGC
jgi:hypothetical protein